MAERPSLHPPLRAKADKAANTAELSSAPLAADMMRQGWVPRAHPTPATFLTVLRLAPFLSCNFLVAARGRRGEGCGPRMLPDWARHFVLVSVNPFSSCRLPVCAPLLAIQHELHVVCALPERFFPFSRRYSCVELAAKNTFCTSNRLLGRRVGVRMCGRAVYDDPPNQVLECAREFDAGPSGRDDAEESK